MAANKTQPTDASVPAFIAAVPNERRRADAAELIAMMGAITREPAVMWGPTMVGFGRLSYGYASGRTGDIFRVGFAPRTSSLVVYNWSEFDGALALIARLGKLKRSAGCLYVNKLDDIDREVLRELLTRGYAWTLERFPPGAVGTTESGQARRAQARKARKGPQTRKGPKARKAPKTRKVTNKTQSRPAARGRAGKKPRKRR